MNKISKGDYGYRDKHKKTMMIIVLLIILAILVQFIASKLVTSANLARILTVMAILTVLPLANQASPLIAVLPYHTPSLDNYERVKNFSNHGLLVCDLIITMREQIMPTDYILIDEKHLYIYLNSIKASEQLTVKFLKDILSSHNLHREIKVMKDYDTYINYLSEHTCINEKVSEGNKEIAAILKSISIT